MKTKKEQAEPVLLVGDLTRDCLERARCEIASSFSLGRAVILVVKSDGGAIDASVDFINWLVDEKTKRRLEVSAKIYTASSAAAAIALATDSRRISQYGRFGLHVGSMLIESTDINRDGVIAERYAALLRKSKERLFNLLRATKISKDKIGTLDAKGRLVLTPVECLKYGICSEIF